MRKDFDEKVWGMVQRQLPIGYKLDIAFFDHEDHTFYHCMECAKNFAIKDNIFVVKLDGCEISEIYSLKEAKRMLKLDKL